MWDTSQLKDASGHRLEGANVLHRCYVTVGCSVLDVSSAVVLYVDKSGAEKGH